MIISHSKKFIFIHVPKNAGTSLEVSFSEFAQWNDLILGGPSYAEQLNSIYSRKFGINKHTSLLALSKLYNFDQIKSFYIFSFVRNPYGRAVSLYNYSGSMLQAVMDKEGLTKNAILDDMDRYSLSYPCLKWNLVRSFLLSGSFLDFIQNPLTLKDPGWRLQSSWIDPPDVSVKIQVFKIESMSQWLPSLAKKLDFPLSMPKKNVSKKLFYRDQMSKHEKGIIYDRFSSDFAAFNYNP